MSLREVQTSAARVVQVDRLNDNSVQELKARFRYHPLDIEALFSVPLNPSFSTYGDYSFVTLLWPDAQTGDTSELRFFIDQKQLTIIGDTPRHDLRKFVDELHQQLGNRESQYTAPELFHEILHRLRQAWTGASTTITTVTATRLAANAQVVRQIGRWLQTSHLPTAVPQLIIDAHALDGLSERRPAAPYAPLATKTNSTTLPSLLQMYTVISAVMILAVIVTLSIQ
jgi:Mg2+ and Co2+ transporter CorA